MKKKKAAKKIEKLLMEAYEIAKETYGSNELSMFVDEGNVYFHVAAYCGRTAEENIIFNKTDWRI